MSTALPFRSRVRNFARAIQAPSAVTVLCSRPSGADAAQIVLRDTIEASPDQARRFAVTMLRSATLCHGGPLDVQVIDADGVLIFALATGGAR